MRPEEELVLEWLTKADDDLRLADLAVGASPPVCWGAAFHAQQAAEKCLKALLTHHRIEFEKSHDLAYLLQLCMGAEPNACHLRPGATGLTDFAVDSRYPFPRHEPDEAQARDAIRVAREVRDFVRERLPRDDSHDKPAADRLADQTGEAQG